MRRSIKAAAAAVVIAASSIVAGAGTALADTPTLPGTPTWWHNGYYNPHVWVDDQTGSSWPVSASANEWNQSNWINVYYHYNGCPYSSGEHCIYAYEGTWSSSTAVATTYWDVDSYGNFRDGYEHIDFNDKYLYLGATALRHTTCQEIGHDLGLNHAESDTGTCMDDLTLNPTLPDSGDWNTLYHLNEPHYGGTNYFGNSN